MIAPLRSAVPEFGGTVNSMTPAPVPLAGVNEIQLVSVVAVHAQSASFVVTVTVDAPPLVAMVCVAGVSV